MSAYLRNFSEADVRTIAFVGGRYDFASALRQLEAGENHLDEPEAWRIAEAFESDTEGDYEPLPMLDHQRDLASKLLAFWASLV